MHSTSYYSRRGLILMSIVSKEMKTVVVPLWGDPIDELVLGLGIKWLRM